MKSQQLERRRSFFCVRSTVFVLAAAAPIGVDIARADSTIFEYQFTGYTFNPTTVSANLAGSALSYVNANPSSPPFTNPPFIVQGGILPDDPPFFLSQGDWFPTAYGYNENYYAFSVTVSPGYALNVSAFSFAANSRQQVPYLTQVQYATSSTFANPISFDTNPISIPTQEVWNTFTASDAAIINGTGTYYFRLYGELDPNGDGSISDLLNIGNISLVGSVQPSAVATPIYWDPSKAGGTGSGGAGTWLAANSWASGAADFTWNNSAALIANFGGSAGGTVTLGGAVSALDGINITTAGYTIAGSGSNLLTVGGTISTSVDATISANIITAGAGTLTKTGSGTLTIAGSAIFANGTSLSITAGTVVVPTGGGVTANGAVQDVAAVPGNVATLTLEGTGAFSTDSALNLADQGGNGTLNIQDSATLSAASIVVGKGVTGSGGTGTVNQTGGTITTASVALATGDSTSVGTYTLSGGTLSAASINGGVGTSTFNFNGGTLQATVDSTDFFSGVISVQVQNGGARIDTNGHTITLSDSLIAAAGSTGGLTKVGLGLLVLSGNNTYTGTTSVSAGTLKVETYTLQSPTINISSGAVLEYDLGSRVFQYPTTFTGAGTLRFAGPGNLVFGGLGVINIDFSPGALIDVEAGLLTGSSSYDGSWGSNMASLNIASGATFDAVEAGITGTTQIDALTGAGTFQGGYFGNNSATSTVTIGVAGGGGTFSGSLRDDASAHLAIIKTGAGTETFAGSNSYTGKTTVAAGKLIIGAAGALPANAQLTIGTNSNAASVQFAPGIGVNILTLMMLDGSTLDLTNNSATIDYTANSTYATVYGYLASGYDSGRWDGHGIDSSIAANTKGSTTLGYSTTVTQMFIKYTWVGDANLDGVVDASDLAAISPSGTTWSTGDFNYDGKVNADDYALFMLGVAESGGRNISVTLPEPLSGLSSLAMICFMATNRRRRSSAK